MGGRLRALLIPGRPLNHITLNSMRYQNWDVLLFPGHSRIPIQEFNSACHILFDRGKWMDVWCRMELIVSRPARSFKMGTLRRSLRDQVRVDDQDSYPYMFRPKPRRWHTLPHLHS